MTFLRRMFPKEPPPQVGQVWESGHSGRRILVSEVSITDEGSLFVYVKWPSDITHDGWGMAELYCIGLSRWRGRLRAEKRTLVQQPEGANLEPQ